MKPNLLRLNHIFGDQKEIDAFTCRNCLEAKIGLHGPGLRPENISRVYKLRLTFLAFEVKLILGIGIEPSLPGG